MTPNSLGLGQPAALEFRTYSDAIGFLRSQQTNSLTYLLSGAVTLLILNC